MTSTVEISFNPLADLMTGKSFGSQRILVEETCMLLDEYEPAPGSEFFVDPHQPLTCEGAILGALRKLYPRASAHARLGAVDAIRKQVRLNQGRRSEFGEHGYHLVTILIDAQPGWLRVTHVLRETSKLLISA